MMPDRERVLRRLLALLAAAVLAAAATAAAAQADPYGEIEHFGAKGTALGELTLRSDAAGFGVDPANNSVYVVDNPTPAESDEFRIQEFSPNAEGHYEAVASTMFTPKDPAAKGKQEELYDTIEGVAVDPEKERVYVLADEERPTCIDEEEEKCTKLYDESQYAAGTLYAFSTAPSGNQIVAAKGVPSNGVLVSPEHLEPLSDTHGVALLEPRGLTVDPASHDVIILASEDRGNNDVGLEENPESTVVLQRIAETGKIAARYVEPTVEVNGEKSLYFEECGCVQSPVVANGHVYVRAEGAIDEIPYDFESTAAPTPVIQRFPEIELGGSLPFINFPAPSAEHGAGLAAGAEGTLYSLASIAVQQEGLCAQGCFHYTGAIAFTPALAEEGYVAGQSESSGGGKCYLSLNSLPLLAAGKEHTLFMLDTDPSDPRIIELGAGGSGCAHATATTPAAMVEGVELPESEPVTVGKEVTLTSTLRGAYALKTEWEFGDGTKQSVALGGTQTSSVEHKFEKIGDFTIAEKISTDDLADPELVEERQIDIDGPPVSVTEPATAVGQASATLNGTVNPGNATVTECKFEYGETTAAGSSVPCTSLPPAGSSPVAVSASLSGLHANTTYHYKLVATNSIPRTDKGGELTLKTEPSESGGPTVETGGASEVKQTSATLGAHVDPNGVAVSECYFQYGVTTDYSSGSAACASLPGSGSAPVPVSAPLAGLSASTTYHYRIVAVSGGVPVYGEDKTFTTEASKQKEEEEAAAAAAAKKHQEEEAAARQRQEEATAAAAAAAKKHQEEEAAAKAHAEEEAAKKKHEEEARSKQKPLTRSQLLAKALKACKKQSKGKRVKCEATARKKYGSKAKKKRKK
jgi:hypothetical protein